MCIVCVKKITKKEMIDCLVQVLEGNTESQYLTPKLPGPQIAPPPIGTHPLYVPAIQCVCEWQTLQ